MHSYGDSFAGHVRCFSEVGIAWLIDRLTIKHRNYGLGNGAAVSNGANLNFPFRKDSHAEIADFQKRCLFTRYHTYAVYDGGYVYDTRSCSPARSVST